MFLSPSSPRGGAVPELPGEGPAQRLGRGVQGTQARQRHRGAVQAHSHLLEPAQRGQAQPSRLPSHSCITCSLFTPWNARALKNAVVSSLAAGRTRPPTPAAFLCPSCCLPGRTGAVVPVVGGQGVGQIHRKSRKLSRFLKCSCRRVTPALHNYSRGGFGWGDAEIQKEKKKTSSSQTRRFHWKNGVWCGGRFNFEYQNYWDSPSVHSVLLPQLLYSCFSVRRKMFGQTRHDLTLQDSSEAFPVCGKRWFGGKPAPFEFKRTAWFIYRTVV